MDNIWRFETRPFIVINGQTLATELSNVRDQTYWNAIIDIKKKYVSHFQEYSTYHLKFSLTVENLKMSLCLLLEPIKIQNTK